MKKMDHKLNYSKRLKVINEGYIVMESTLSKKQQSLFHSEKSIEASLTYWTVNDGNESIMSEIVSHESISNGQHDVKMKNIRLSLDDFEPFYTVINPSFRVLDFVSLLLSGERSFCQDYNVPVYAGSLKCKGDFARSLKDILEEHLIPKEAENDIMNCLFNFFGDLINLPIKLTTIGERRKIQILCGFPTVHEDSDTENAKSVLDEYSKDISRYIEVDQCINDCVVYAGNEENLLFQCPNQRCKEFRFRPCTRAGCPGQKVLSSECEHLLKDGIPYKRLFYRFLIPNIIDLLNTKYFLCALNYQNDILLKGNLGDLFIYDIFDGSIPIEHCKFNGI
jgi:hypothetical protein